MDDVIARQYAEYPYPNFSTPTKIVRRDPRFSYTAMCYLAFSEYREATGKMVLDAGCGTGQTIVDLSTNNSGLIIEGIDVSESSVAIANRHFKHLGIEAAAQATVLPIEQLNCGRTYDLIICTGVLHHLADPLTGLQALERTLKFNGCMSLLVYSEHGRQDIRSARDILRLLTRDFPNMEEKIKLTRRFISTLDSTSRHYELFQRFSKILEIDSHIVDMFFNAREVNYQIPELFKLLDSANLRFIKFFDESFWSGVQIKDGPLESVIKGLSPMERLHLVDLLTQCHSTFHFLVAHKDYNPAQNSISSSTVPVVSPIAELAPTDDSDKMFAHPHTICSSPIFVDGVDAKVLQMCDGLLSASDIAARLSFHFGGEAITRVVNSLRTLSASELIYFK